MQRSREPIAGILHTHSERKDIAMQFGLHLGTRGAASTRSGLAALSRHAESIGFSYVGLSDHIVIAAQVETEYPYTEDGRWFAQDSGFCLDQLAVLAFLAGVTETIRLLTSVMVLPYREPLLTAKMLATADVLSEGRVTAGVGAGWMAEEMALLSSPPFEARGTVTREYVEAFKVLWTEARPAYQGKYVAFDDLLFEPKPHQRPHPPIWIGGESKPARRRAAQVGDGWYPVSNNPRAPLDTPERFGAAWREVCAMATEAGRQPEALDAALLGLGLRLANGPIDGERRTFTGSAEQICDDIRGFQAQGLGTLVVAFESNDLNQSLDQLSAFADSVMAQCRP